MKKFYSGVVLAKIEYIGNASKTFSSRLWQEIVWCGHRHKSYTSACSCAARSCNGQNYLEGFVAIKDARGELWSITNEQKIDAVKVKSADKDVCDYCLKENPTNETNKV